MMLDGGRAEEVLTILLLCCSNSITTSNLTTSILYPVFKASSLRIKGVRKVFSPGKKSGDPSSSWSRRVVVSRHNHNTIGQNPFI